MSEAPRGKYSAFYDETSKVYKTSVYDLNSLFWHGIVECFIANATARGRKLSLHIGNKKKKHVLPCLKYLFRSRPLELV